ncbi:MAG: hypothetical protein JW956_00910 [Calditrichaceae bacterium]|nr:hypothetical protein [Calditrichaceae bacterium]
MQILNMSFRRLLFKKSGVIEPEKLFKLERLTALRHQLTEEKRLSIRQTDPDRLNISQTGQKKSEMDSVQKQKINNRQSTLITNPKLQNQLNDLDVQVNKLFVKDKVILNAYQRAYIISRKVALYQNHFFQIPMRNVFQFLILILAYKWAQIRKYFKKFKQRKVYAAAK